LSRRHARLRVVGDRVTVTDLGSTNQTHVAGKKILPDVETPVPPGTDIVFGAFRTVLVCLSAEPGGGKR
jgi:pSer/pThr/pTyr-binding forkhead associated (FHA) protein